VSQIHCVPDHAGPNYETVDASAIEPKTKAATVAGAGSATVITPVVVLLIDDLIFGGGPVDVPRPYVGVIVTGACTFAASHFARHVNRAV
jgi:hypothetical protein